MDSREWPALTTPAIRSIMADMAKTAEMKMTGIAHGGEAMGKLGPRTVFVAYALPGETVRIDLVEEHERWARGELRQVLSPHPQRVEPPCPHFGLGRCGSCQWQHMTLAAQREYKRQIVSDQLERLGKARSPRVQATVGAGPEWAYRTQAVFLPSGDGPLGQRRQHRPGVHPIDRCPVLHPGLAALYEEFNAEWEGLRSVDFSVGRSEEQRLVTLRTAGNELPEIEVDVPVSIALETGSGSVQALIGEPFFHTTLRGHRLRWSAGTRRPINLDATEAIMAIVADYLAPDSASGLLDLWCGNGLVLADLASRVERATGIEEHPLAVEDCAANCERMANVTLHEGTPAEVLAHLPEEYTLAVMTPPGEGMAAQVADALSLLGVRRLVYVAHSPAWLARDLQDLQRAGFRLHEVTPVDVAPQTYFVTAVALFLR